QSLAILRESVSTDCAVEFQGSLERLASLRVDLTDFELPKRRIEVPRAGLDSPHTLPGNCPERFPIRTEGVAVRAVGIQGHGSDHEVESLLSGSRLLLLPEA